MQFRYKTDNGVKTHTIGGREGEALEQLIRRGKNGVTQLEYYKTVGATRLGAYIHRLRHDWGLWIETLDEQHEALGRAATHARYVLRQNVKIVKK